MKRASSNIVGIFSLKAKFFNLKSSAQRDRASKANIQENFTRATQAKNLSRGFTLLELLVSISIFTVITTIAVFNNTQFNSSVLLTNLAYEVGLSVRQAQFYGITVKQTAGDPTAFDSGYGVHFDTSSPSTYVLFEDVNTCVYPAICTNKMYDVGDVGTETFNIQKGNLIGKICVTDSSNVTSCSNSVVDIAFVRPNPDAYIRANGAGTAYQKAEICIYSPKGAIRKVIVESTGQISVTHDANGVCPAL